MSLWEERKCFAGCQCPFCRPLKQETPPEPFRAVHRTTQLSPLKPNLSEAWHYGKGLNGRQKITPFLKKCVSKKNIHK
jgi:hypothetical protein